jgi:toxic protein SymE
MIPQSNTPAIAPRPEEGASTSQHNVAAKARRVKMGYSYPPSRASKPSCIATPVPYLRLRGNWLRSAGFSIGGNVRVEVNEGRLTIQPVD